MNTFSNRVDAERRVLRVVNASGVAGHELHGLSRPAIRKWRQYLQGEKVSEIEHCLLELSDACQRLSDRSHESLAELANPVDLTDLLEKLEQLVTRPSKDDRGLLQPAASEGGRST